MEAVENAGNLRMGSGRVSELCILSAAPLILLRALSVTRSELVYTTTMTITSI